MAYKLIEVSCKKSHNDFLELPVKLYKNEPNWIRPLNNDIEDVFNPKTNKLFRKGEAIRWVLFNHNQQPIGRVAAFIDRETAKSYEQPTGGMGFFECINDKDAAFLLFDACKQWLQDRAMEAMDGPVNFGDRDRWWGLLIDGDFPPNYCMDYHKSYYKELFDAYGFKPYFYQYTYYRPVNAQDVDPVIWEKAERIAKNPAYTIKSIERKRVKQFAIDFKTIYNNAWGRYTGVKKITDAHAMALLKTVKPILDEDLMYFAYYEDEPVGFLIMLPDINQVVKHLNGKFNLFNKLRFLYLLRVKKICTKAVGIIFGIVARHQGKGLEGAMVNELAKKALRDDFQYKDIELNWIGDFNPGMRRVAEQIGGKVRKTHVTLRYMFDPTKEVTPPRRVS
ncbi:MAG: hypothetical protein JW783_06695 [Bacteroidales bacterium]|nr:hypothetical protein [Bacteroidales bacterium]MBN2750068.1 hypothetical protein [Bacteroidales bacterium]